MHNNKEHKIGNCVFVLAVMICAAFAGIVSYNSTKTEALADNGDAIIELI